MRDKDLYAKILGIEEPWYVRDIDLRLNQGEVFVYLDFKSNKKLCCPSCGQQAPGYDRRERRWRHLDTCQYRTIIVADVPRVNCKEHGVHQIKVPWSEPGSRFTLLFESLVIDWLFETTTSAVSRQLNLSWDEVDGIMLRAVKRGLSRRSRLILERIGVDETSFQKRHEYVTVVSDQGGDRVVFVADGRKRASLDAFYEELDPEQLEAIKSVSMDMADTYINSTKTHVPGADKKIAFDKFHVAKNIGDAVDKVRRDEHKALNADGESPLTKTKYFWLQNPENMDMERWQNFESLRNSALKTARAWSIKEFCMTLWNYKTRTWAEKAWKRCIGWMLKSRLEPIIKSGRTIKNHLWGILNAVVLNVSNAKAEGLNAKIQKLKSQACGFRNRERFRNMIYFHLGGLNLYPGEDR